MRFFLILALALCVVRAFIPRSVQSLHQTGKKLVADRNLYVSKNNLKPLSRVRSASEENNDEVATGLAENSSDIPTWLQGMRKFTKSKLYESFEVIVVFALLSCFDGGFSGDWSRYGLIDTQIELTLRTISMVAIFGHILLALVAGYFIKQRKSPKQPVLPAMLYTLVVGFMGFFKVYLQTDEDAIKLPSKKEIRFALAERAAGNYDKTLINEFIDENLNKNTFVMFSYTTCPYCIKAKDILLNKYKVDMKVIELDKDKSTGYPIRVELGKRTGRTSVPSVWLNGAFLGGCNDGPTFLEIPQARDGLAQINIRTKGGIVALDSEGTLETLLRATELIA